MGTQPRASGILRARASGADLSEKDGDPSHVGHLSPPERSSSMINYHQWHVSDPIRKGRYTSDELDREKREPLVAPPGRRGWLRTGPLVVLPGLTRRQPSSGVISTVLEDVVSEMSPQSERGERRRVTESEFELESRETLELTSRIPTAQLLPPSRSVVQSKPVSHSTVTYTPAS